MSEGLVDPRHEPLPRLPYLEDARFSARRHGPPPRREGVDIFIFCDVLEELCYRALYDPGDGSFSLLVGGWYVGPTGRYVEIEGFRDAIHVDGAEGPIHYLRAHPDLLQEAAQTAPQVMERILGYSLVKPGSRARASATEFMLHNTFFNRPYHVLLMIDARHDALGFYLRDEAGGLRSAPFWVLDVAGAGERGRRGGASAG